MSVDIYSQLKSGRPENFTAHTEKTAFDFLFDAGIDFKYIEHSAADTIEACHEIEKHTEAEICKNLFLKNSAETEYFLLLLDGDTKFVSKDISKQIGSTRLSFASEERLYDILSLKAGSVSILGLINDKNKCVKLLIQDTLLEKEYLCCHPCVNTKTLKIRTDDIINKFIPLLGYTFTTVHL